MTIEDSAVADEALVARLLDGDEEALGLLYDRHARAAFSLAVRILTEAQAAEDVVQEAFLALWRRAETYRPERGSVRTWLLTVVRYRAIDVLRGPARRGPPAVSVDDLALAAPDSPEGDALRAVEGRVVREALAELPPEQREVVELAYFGGFSYPEVAERMNIPLGTVKSRMRLALERLRAVLDARGFGP